MNTEWKPVQICRLKGLVAPISNYCTFVVKSLLKINSCFVYACVSACGYFFSIRACANIDLMSIYMGQCACVCLQYMSFVYCLFV